jgi:hypothetical protein
MDQSDFNEWRAKYDEMTDLDQYLFYEQAYKEHPQEFSACHPTSVLEFFEEFCPIEGGDVVEIGGFRGELAKFVLPHLNVRSWHNLDICEAALKDSVCTDSRYKPIPVPFHFWEHGPYGSGSILISVHCIEHLSVADFTAAIDIFPGVAPGLVDLEIDPETGVLPLQAIYLDAPLPAIEGIDWHDECSTHKFEGSWRDVDVILAARDFVCVKEWNTFCAGTARAYVKVA